MSSIKLVGSTSGEITIAAPAVAGTNTLTLPASTGNILTDGAVANNGIYLGGTASANLLDDYEEGTWTPVWNAASGSMTYSKQSGLYTKVGSLVVAYCHIITSSNNSFSGGVYLSGLPFIAEGTGITYTACPMHAEQLNLATSAWVWGHVVPGQATVSIRYWINNAAAGTLVGTQMNNGSDMMITCSYKTLA